MLSGPDTYFCGVQASSGTKPVWYGGIQETKSGSGRVIFSAWNPSQEGQCRLDEHKAGAFTSRFSVQGGGLHAHWDCQAAPYNRFRFVIVTGEGVADGQAMTRFYFYNQETRDWELLCATSASKSRDLKRRSSNSLISFINTWNRLERVQPKLALFRLWRGNGPGVMREVTAAEGDGFWGRTNDAFFEGSGDSTLLASVLADKFGSRAVLCRRGEVAQHPASPLPDLLSSEIRRLQTHL